MANDEFREQQQASREVGLKARHETRVERAIRRQVAEEIADAIQAYDQEWSAYTWQSIAARIALEIGSQEGSG
jgi:hypothetical protein